LIVGEIFLTVIMGSPPCPKIFIGAIQEGNNGKRSQRAEEKQWAV